MLYSYLLLEEKKLCVTEHGIRYIFPTPANAKEGLRLDWLRSCLVKTFQALHRVHRPIGLVLDLFTSFAILFTHSMLGQPALLRFVSMSSQAPTDFGWKASDAQHAARNERSVELWKQSCLELHNTNKKHIPVPRWLSCCLALRLRLSVVWPLLP